MERNSSCTKVGLNRGAWTATEDKILTDYIKIHGEGRWRNLPNKAGLKRCGKSCRLRWLNYLRPGIKRGNVSHDEEELIIRLHRLLGNRWSLIARRLPGRTDNEIKNYWNTYLAQKIQDDRTVLSTKNPNHSRSTNNKKKQVIQPTKNVGSSPQVIRTKAYKCRKVFFTPQPAKVEGIAMNPKVHQQPVAMEPYNPRQFTPCHDDNDMDGFILNFNMDDLCLSEFLDSNFSLLRNTEELSMQDGNISKELSSSPLGNCV